MKNQEIKFNSLKNNYSIIIGNNALNFLPKKIKSLCPKTKKIALVFDTKIPNKYKKIITNKLKNYELLNLNFVANEKNKSLDKVNFYIKKILSNNFNRSDLIISIGGGITGDVTGFVASIYKRGINFINIPTTLLAQVDSSVGGKTGVNTIHGKNLIGSFYQPKLVISDTIYLKSLPKKYINAGISFFSFVRKSKSSVVSLLIFLIQNLVFSGSMCVMPSSSFAENIILPYQLRYTAF